MANEDVGQKITAVKQYAIFITRISSENSKVIQVEKLYVAFSSAVLISY